MTALPLAAAPMAGGPSTVALARAVASAGAFPFVAGGYRTVDALAGFLDALDGLDFGVNLFVPSPSPIPLPTFRAYATSLHSEASRYGLTLPSTPLHDTDGWAEKLDLLLQRPVPVVSLTFGLPDTRDIAALRRAGSRVLATVTTPDEAAAAASHGVDGLIVQGHAAGGHSATFDPARFPAAVETSELVGRVLARVPLPVIAAGGVDGPVSVRDLLRAGARSVAVGTLLLLTDEAGTNATHRSALTDPAYRETVLTRAFTGRPARALRNAFIDRHDHAAPVGYPAVHHLTRDLRRAAATAGDPGNLHLWAGTGHRQARSTPAADVITALAQHL